jgi:hypothetical protein
VSEREHRDAGREYLVLLNPGGGLVWSGWTRITRSETTIVADVPAALELVPDVPFVRLPKEDTDA